MTPAEREKRIEAATSGVLGWTRSAAEDIFDRADDAVPVVSREQHEREIAEGWENIEAMRAERDEARAAARDFASAIHESICTQHPDDRDFLLVDALDRHPGWVE